MFNPIPLAFCQISGLMRMVTSFPFFSVVFTICIYRAVLLKSQPMNSSDLLKCFELSPANARAKTEKEGKLKPE